MFNELQWQLLQTRDFEFMDEVAKLFLVLAFRFGLLAGAAYLCYNGWSLWTLFWAVVIGDQVRYKDD